MTDDRVENTADKPFESAGEGAGISMREEAITLLDLLAIIAKYKRMIVLAVFIAALAASIIAFVIPNRYTATTTLIPPQQQTSLASALVSQLGGIGVLGTVAGKDLGLKNPSDIYVGMLKSRVIADTLIQNFDLMTAYRDKKMTDAREDLEQASNIQAGQNGLITISVEDKDRQRAAALANAYVEELKKLTATLAVTEASQRRAYFGQQLQKSKDDLADAEIALKQTQQKTGLIQLDGQATAIIESVTKAQAQIAAKEVQLQAMQSYATEQNPNLVLLRQELAGLQAQLAKLEKQRNSGRGDIRVPTAGIPEAGLEYLRRLRDVKYYETIFELLAKQFEIAKLDEAREGILIQVVDPAVLPDKKSYPPRALIVVGIALLACFIASLWAIFAEVLSRRKDDPRVRRQLSEIHGFLSWNPRPNKDL
jgi:tyrosine-protein kinase Etk/Wzc